MSIITKRYEEVRKDIEGRREEWGTDPYFRPEAWVSHHLLARERDDKSFELVTTGNSCRPFLLLHEDHALVRYPRWSRNSSGTGGGDNNVLEYYTGLRASSRRDRPGVLFHVGDSRCQATGWVWTDGTEVRPHGVQLVRTLDRKALTSVNKQIRDLTAPLMARVKLGELFPVEGRRDDLPPREAFARKLLSGSEDYARLATMAVAAGGRYLYINKQNPTPIRHQDVTRGITASKEALWRALGAVLVTEQEAA